MRVVIVGMGVQGLKRKRMLGKDFKYSVDKFKRADYRFIDQVPLKEYDAVIEKLETVKLEKKESKKKSELLRIKKYSLY